MLTATHAMGFETVFPQVNFAIDPIGNVPELPDIE